jgi:hypothetical protein
MKSLLLISLILGLAAYAPAAEPAASASLAKDSRCFEMRTYYPAPGKFEALHARFRDHTNKLFVKHGMELVGYWVPTDKAQEKLVYILAHKSRDAAKQSWQDFQNDPAWKKAHAESEINGKLVDKVEVVFMSATDYSPIK